MSLFDAFTSICIPLDGLPEALDTAPDPEALAIQAQQREHISALFIRLFGLSDAVVLCMLYLDDLTAQDVAEVWGMSEDQINYIRRKALKVLRTNTEIASLLRPTATR